MLLRWKPPLTVTSTIIVTMSFKPVIPWQVALQQSLPPLHRLETIVRQFLTLRKLHFDQQKGDISNVAK
jgi:hypothetical protein